MEPSLGFKNYSLLLLFQHQQGKALNRPIAPAAGALVSMSLSNQFTPSFVSSSAMQGYGIGPGHPMMGPNPMSRTPMMMSAMPHQHAFASHVPLGAAAAARAGAAPRSASTLRNPTIPNVAKPPGVATSQAGPQTTTLQSQAHASVSTAVSRSQSPVVSIAQRAVITAASTYQQGLEHKQGDVRDPRPPVMSDKARRAVSPHCPSPTVHNTVSTHQAFPVPGKTGTVTSSVSSNVAAQKPVLTALPVAVHQSQGHSSAAVSSSGSSTTIPSSSTTGPSAMTQSKFMSSNSISVTPILSLGRGYSGQHPMAFQAARQPMAMSDSSLVSSS